MFQAVSGGNKTEKTNPYSKMIGGGGGYLGEGETLVGGMRPSSVSCLTILVLDKGMNRHYYFMWGGGGLQD